MGYIQFDRVEIPQDNLVSLSYLNQQLERQKTQLTGHDFQSEDHLNLDNFMINELPSEESDLENKSVPQKLQQSISTEQLWELFMSGGDILDQQLISNESFILGSEPSLDEEICNHRFNKIFPTIKNAGISTSCGNGTISNLVGTSEFKAPTVEDCGEVFQCPHCPSKFKVKGYLTRHIKKHLPKKDYQCPYWSLSCKCHPNGEFSRKDTYRTHLKSIHFVYPVGTSKHQRNNCKGRCAACYMEFPTNVDWLKFHIDTKMCSAFKLKTEG